MIWLLVVAALAAAVPAGLRWLRVAQREHYLPPAATRFALRWWGLGASNFLLAVIALVGLFGSLTNPAFGLLAALAQVGPLGLSIRGRTSELAWTERLKRVGGVAGALYVAIVALGAVLDLAFLIALAIIAVPLIVDLSLAVLAPIERRLGDRWVEKAASRLESSDVRVVAITGSFGKTSTKQYVHHLLSPSVRTVASPASFNNRMGLARAINEHLVAGTEVFIAEMGTYGVGEIADLCSWIEPEVASIVSIGPVHLERFGSVETIVAAKSEILDRAKKGVLSIDHPLLAKLADDREDSLELTRVSASGAQADVTVEDGFILASGERLGRVPDGVFPTNLAIAVAIVRALGEEVDPELFVTLPRAEHRQSVTTSERGFTIIDDTFNSNPAGASLALSRLAEAPGKKVLVTPGMVELGELQDTENESFARSASTVCDRIVIVGATNRKALLRGAESGSASVTVVDTREAAVALIRDQLGEGDAVLYENDLPDHYP